MNGFYEKGQEHPSNELKKLLKGSVLGLKIKSIKLEKNGFQKRDVCESYFEGGITLELNIC